MHRYKKNDQALVRYRILLRRASSVLRDATATSVGRSSGIGAKIIMKSARTDASRNLTRRRPGASMARETWQAT